MFANIKKRRVVTYCLVALLATACLIGCGNDESDAEAAALLDESLDLLEASDAYSYKVETVIERPQSFSEDVMEVSIILEPYIAFNSTIGVELIAQIYQRENPDGSMDMFIRSAEKSKGEFGEWNLNHIEPELADIILPNAKDNMKHNIELLRANKTLFKQVGNEQIDGKNAIVLKGTITPDSAAEVYNNYIRGYYKAIGMVEDKNLTVEEAKDEIITSEIAELKIGIPGLAFSPNNIPVTIWIDAKTHIPLKLELDKKDVMQAIQSTEQIEKAIVTYTLLDLGDSVSISTMPENIE